MKVSELYRQVSQLGFEDSLDSDERFYYAANRALDEISLIHPKTDIYPLYHCPFANIGHSESIKDFQTVEFTGDIEMFATNAKSLYLEYLGEIDVKIYRLKDEEYFEIQSQTKKLPFAYTFTPYRQFIPLTDEYGEINEIKLEITSQNTSTVRNVAIYGKKISDNIKDIPKYKQMVAYDMRELVPDFLNFCSPPFEDKDLVYRMTDGYQILRSTLYLPRNAEGVYNIHYEKMPTPIKMEQNASDNEDEIDLDRELVSLMPLLVASYVWLEDNPEQASYYGGLYSDRAVQVIRNIKKPMNDRVKNVNGW